MTTSTLARVTPGAQVSKIYRVRGQRARWRYPNERLSPEYCEVLNDVNLSERGTAESRGGYKAFNVTQITGGEPVVGLYEATFANAAVKKLVVTPTKIYTDTGSARVDITGNAMTGGNDDRARVVMLKDQTIINNTIDQPQVWAGDDTTPVAAADLGGIPFTKCVDIITHQNLLLALGTTESSVYYPTRVRWCDVNRSTFVVDITSWPAANRYEIYDGGPKIIGAVDNWGQALIFKEDGLYPGHIEYSQLGHYDFRLGEPRRGFHPVSRMSLVARPEFVFGAAKEGIFTVDPELNVKIVNTDDVNTWLGLNQSRLQYTQASVREKDHQVRLLCSSVNNSTGHDRVLVWDWDTGDVWFDRLTHDMGFLWSVTVSNEELDWFGSYNGYLYQGNKQTYLDDAGTGFSWRIKMCPNDLGLPGIEKHVLNVKTLYRRRSSSQSISLLIHVDEGQQSPVRGTLSLRAAYQWNTGKKWNTGLKWPGAGVRGADLWVNRVCTEIAPEWYSNSPANVEGYQVEFVPLEGMGE